MDLVHRSLPRAQGIAESFDGDVNTDLIPVFEAVCHGFRWAVDPDLNTLNDMGVDSLGECAAREAQHTQRWRFDRRLVRLEVDGQPDLVRVLSG
jgi:hypothetical protein